MNLPPYKIFPTLLSETVILREVQTEDIEALIEISYYDSIQATSYTEASQMLSKIHNDYLQGQSIHWGIVEKATQSIVGTCGYYRGFSSGAGELGCVLLSQYRGKGYMRKAMTLAIDFGLQSMKLNRIWASTYKHNFKAISLLERLHFIQVTTRIEDEIEFELQKVL